MKTRITELLGIKYPIILSGMSWISVPRMVAAVSNAGGLGILATGPLDPETTRKSIREIRSLTDKPFGANATLLFPGAAENTRVLLEEKVPVINFALGKGDRIVREVHKYGGKVLATVVTHRHAKRAQEYGTDALISTGYEAAGHGGPITNLVLIPSLVDSVDIPIIAAGGFGDGRGLAAALALGAEGIAMGTRFMTTKESGLHEHFKKVSIERSVYDTLYTPRIDGLDCRVMDTNGARRSHRRGLDLMGAFFNSRGIARQLHLPYFKLVISILASGWKNTRHMANMANAFHEFRLATEEGDEEKGVLPVGQVMGMINDSPSVSELIERMVKEAEGVGRKLSTQLFPKLTS
ncbi:MAG TPA: nitronate monooxygenase [Smithella sp.]|nr:nitronate monooxygenase [Smithella sp.]HPL67532.1 nitronate monooxygenase [Smithellaceae bacterium]